MDLPQDTKVTCRQHRETLGAVRSGDAIRAEKAMREHFGNIRMRVTATAPDETNRRPHERE